jgi:FKBP-type peptidyl-prolyl cis-trans isomerase FkpA
MKNWFWALLLPVFVISCKKEEKSCPEVNIKAPEAEVAALRTYISGNSITATEDARGFFYTINTAGTGTQPTACSDVSVNYTGKLTNGTQFDSGNNVGFNLSQLIIGWQMGIPLMKTGGAITLYLPPSLAYGPNAVGSIPANSILIFTITLNAVF